MLIYRAEDGAAVVMRVDRVDSSGEPIGEWRRMRYCLPCARHTARDGWDVHAAGNKPRTIRTARRALQGMLGYRGDELNDIDFELMEENRHAGTPPTIFYVVDAYKLAHAFNHRWQYRGGTNDLFRRVYVDATWLDFEDTRELAWLNVKHRRAFHLHEERVADRDPDPLIDAREDRWEMLFTPHHRIDGRFRKVTLRAKYYEAYSDAPNLICYEMDDCTIICITSSNQHRLFPFVREHLGHTYDDVLSMSEENKGTYSKLRFI